MTQDPEAAVKSCYATWSASYYEDYYGAAAPYPPVHRDLVLRLVREAGARRVLDAGCGPASFMRHLADEGMDVFGFDLTDEMVVEARRVLAERGLDPGRVWQGSVLDPDAYHSPGSGEISFDAAVCVGVLPHVPEGSDELVFAGLRSAVRDGGLVAVEARNELFALFTLNRYSYEFFANELIRADGRRLGPEESELHASALVELRERFRMDQPPIRAGTRGEPGYDEVLSRTHNPLVLRRQFEEAGFRDVEVNFYHYHWLPPMFEAKMPEAYRRASVSLEDPRDWRGYFTASAFVLTGRRA